MKIAIICSFLLISCGSYQSNYSENSTYKNSKAIVQRDSRIQGLERLNRSVSAKNLVISREITTFKDGKIVQVVKENIKDRGKESNKEQVNKIESESNNVQVLDNTEKERTIEERIKKNNNVFKDIKGVFKWLCIFVILACIIYVYRKIVR